MTEEEECEFREEKGGDVKSEPRSAVLIAPVLATASRGPARVSLCSERVRWTAGFRKKGPHSAGSPQMLALVARSSGL